MSGPVTIRLTLGEQLAVLAVTLVASAVAVAWSWTHAAFLLYGDAEAHIHIARRLFDSHRPGITQLGSVWLPLPHLVLAPLLMIDPWWRSGFAPVIPSAACYLLACMGLYRLARFWLTPPSALLGLALFATNPNLLYLQTTAMTEPLFLAELIWTVLLLVDWHQSLSANSKREGRLLWILIAVQVAAVYTRYDGWILAFLAWCGMATCLFRRGRLFRTNFILASVILLAAPVTWVVYNQVVFGDWLDFMRGPYSARAIEARTSASAVDPHPGWHNPWVALLYFLKAAEMDVAAFGWGEAIALLAAIGTGWGALQAMRPGAQSDGFITRSSKQTWLWTLLLWLPLPFYAYSVSYGSVPIFLPSWKPFSWYNTRYGMELVPALALFFGFAMDFLLGLLKHRRALHLALMVTVALLLAANCLFMLRQGPLTLIEAQKNTEARGYYNHVLTEALGTVHAADPGGIVLMDTSNYPSLVPHAGLTYRQTINESDKEFYWAALGAPAAHADMVLAFAGSDIDKAVHAHPEHLRVYQTFHSPNQGWDQLDATLYVSDTFPLPASLPAAPATPAR